ncbi:MAG: S8 family serine peptidase, partial [Actinomycetota bacterium]|nr:S8 family serine peptidase [Actinomycetota bacterium]
PAYPTPAYPTPAYPTPAYPTPSYPTPRRSSARPAPPSAPIQALSDRYATSAQFSVEGPQVIVLDTGLAGALFPDALTPAPVQPASASEVDEPDNPPDGFLDPAAGHGTFIAGLVQQVAPGCSVTVHGVVEPTGPVDEWTVIIRMAALVPETTEQTILNLSFGGYALDQPAAFAWAVRELQATGAVVVASAGNDASCRPSYPAALPEVVSVGAVGPAGPAPFTNFGPWVRACAPGVDLLSTFFQGWNGDLLLGADGIDPDDFAGWAIWSGTSFSAPVVAGALARMMMAEGLSAQAAVKRVIDAPSLMRIPDLGTVVNVV